MAPLPRLDLNEHRRQVARDSAMRSNPLGFGPLWQLSIRMGAIPIKVYSFTDAQQGIREEAPDHPGYRLLRRPNPELTRSLMVAGTVSNMFTYNRAFWLIVRDPDDQPAELWPIPPVAMTPIRSATELISHFELRPSTGGPEPVDKRDVLYFRLLPAPEDWADALAPFEPLGEMLGMGREAIKAAAEFYETGDLHSLWVAVKGRLSPEAERRLEAKFERERRKRFRVPAFEEGNELKSTGGTGGADQTLFRGIDAVRDVVKDTLGLPADGDRKRFYSEAVAPVADAIEQELERGLFSQWPSRPAFPEFAFRDILKGEPQEVIESHARAILTMQETPDEARRDRNLPPRGGPAAELWGPLNQVTITEAPEDGQPRPRDTAGGMGGDEGRDTLAPQVQQPQNRPPTEPTRARVIRLGRRRYGQRRARLLAGQATALGRQLRGVLKREARAVRDAVQGRRAAQVGFPSKGELLEVVGRLDPELAQRLRAFMEHVGDESWSTAAELMGLEAEVSARVSEVIARRAGEVVELFGGNRESALGALFDRAVEEGMTTRDLGAAVGEVYQGLADRFVDGIARTEVAFAHEQAALTAWADAGVEEMEVVFGGGPCSTGICEEIAGGSPYRLGQQTGDVGYSFEGADAPPFHPNDTCFVVPFLGVEEREAAAAG
jgi:phage portal protein BeeE